MIIKIQAADLHICRLPPSEQDLFCHDLSSPRILGVHGDFFDTNLMLLQKLFLKINLNKPVL
jgi:hypothetical protein